MRRAAMRLFTPWLASVVMVAACAGACASSHPSEPAQPAAPGRTAESPPPPPRTVTLAVVGTSDLHGHLEMLPYLAGHLANLRAAPGVDGVIVIDAGDMFQGTLESNLNEGAAVIEAYNHLDYAAAAVGNHEFDFGPVGARSVPRANDDDPRGALKARAAQARFPLLAANVLDSAGPVSWPNVAPSVLVERAGVRVGIIGVTTESTPRATSPRNFGGLAVAPLAPTIAREAAALRRRGARVVLVAAHAGGSCRELDDPAALLSCKPDEEIFRVARALPSGAVDVIVAGHTHAGVAHEVAGIAIVQSFVGGVAFGRVDLAVDPAQGPVGRRIHPPRFVCGDDPARLAGAGRGSATEGAPSCAPGSYEGRPVTPDERLAPLLARHMQAARAASERDLGVLVERAVRGARREESALGNLFADLMLAARPDADVAITNGGGLRADLPAGRLTYGALYRAMPFDNTFALVRVTGAQLLRAIAGNLEGERGIVSISGMRVTARCRGAALELTLRRASGARLRAKDKLLVVTSDFLASGGDGLLTGLDLPEGAVHFEDGIPIREEIAARLQARGGRLRGDDPRLHNPRAPRIVLPGPRPVRCQ